MHIYIFYLSDVNIFYFYAFSKGASIYFMGLGYTDLPSKGSKESEKYSKKKHWKFSEIICMSECQCWILSKAVQKGQICLYGNVWFPQCMSELYYWVLSKDIH